MTHFARMSMGSVHPHVRGEHPGVPMKRQAVVGSSPRAWGTLHALHQPRWPRTVHPHVRGEHGELLLATNNVGGSSPRAWGTRHHEQRHRLRGRFIPTCVGNTLQHAPCASAHPVHPHVRGEHA